MVSDRIKINLDDLDDSNFKSCFARSMALNSSQRKYTKSLLSKQKLPQNEDLIEKKSDTDAGAVEHNTLRKVSFLILMAFFLKYVYYFKPSLMNF